MRLTVLWVESAASAICSCDQPARIRVLISWAGDSARTLVESEDVEAIAVSKGAPRIFYAILHLNTIEYLTNTSLLTFGIRGRIIECMSYLSENLAALLNQRKMNATNLAQATGVPQPTIHRILKGVSRDPRTDTIQPIAEYFGVPLETLRSTYLGMTLPRPSRKKDNSAPNWKTRVSEVDIFNNILKREQEFLSELEKQLDKKLDRRPPDLAGNPKYCFDYVSDRVVAEFSVVPVRARRVYPETTPSAELDLDPVTRRLWQMLCSKKVSSRRVGDRHYLMFLDPMSTDPGADVRRIIPSVVDLIAEAQTQGMYVYWQGPQDAATIVATVEHGAHPSNADTILDFEDLSDSQ